MNKGVELLIDIVFGVIALVALLVFWQTGIVVAMWIAIIFGGLAIFMTLFIMTDGFDDLDLF